MGKCSKHPKHQDLLCSRPALVLDREPWGKPGKPGKPHPYRPGLKTSKT